MADDQIKKFIATQERLRQIYEDELARLGGISAWDVP